MSPNKLIGEKSPYLRQHATNPVDWHPWGDEPFTRALNENKPVLLSIGYSTCHWCHVMEEEVFSDEEAARLINETFISVKVDREERPDIDAVYMAASHAATGSGGWPLNVLLTPDRMPFFVATYLPKESMAGRMGMMDLCKSVKELWERDRVQVENSSLDFTAQMNFDRTEACMESPDMKVIERAVNGLSDRYDAVNGGFGTRPKFPTTHNLIFLLRNYHRTKNTEILDIVENTLRKMRFGGLYDQLGYGFHRYSTDPVWLVPHFEKMLYDQAMALSAYTEAFSATGDDFYKGVASEICAYLLRDLTSLEGEDAGAFYAGEDADSEGKEGTFYLWTEEELRAVLDEEEAVLARRYFNTSSGGNYRDEVTGTPTGKNILYISPASIETGAAGPEMDKIREKLFRARLPRQRPFRDEKILTDWNGLMIAALAKAGATFGNEEYIKAARRAADFLLSNLTTPDGHLLHRYMEGEAAIDGFLDDYAHFVWGLMELYGATFEESYFCEAIKINSVMMREFHDPAEGGFWFTAKGSEELIVRTRNDNDNVYPSGNSAAVMNLLRLSKLTGDAVPDRTSRGLLEVSGGEMSLNPMAYTALLTALDYSIGTPIEIVIAGARHAPDTAALIKVVRESYLPNLSLLLLPTGEEAEIVKIAPFLNNITEVDGKATAYLCKDFSCTTPMTDPLELKKLLTA